MDDELLREADRTARQMGMSRSRLFALAVGDFLQRHHQQDRLRRLNEVYRDASEPAENRLMNGIKAKVNRTVRDRW